MSEILQYVKSDNYFGDVCHIIDDAQRSVDTALVLRNCEIGKRIDEEILSWIHYRILAQVEDTVAREWYAREAYTQVWNAATLQRNISSQYYYRMSQTHGKACEENEDCSIDLVFYNYILKCFVLIDLKTEKITYQDVGQMDMCIRMYDELKKQLDDGPTLGIVLCADTDEDIARYSVLHGNEHLFHQYRGIAE